MAHPSEELAEAPVALALVAALEAKAVPYQEAHLSEAALARVDSAVALVALALVAALQARVVPHQEAHLSEAALARVDSVVVVV